MFPLDVGSKKTNYSQIVSNVIRKLDMTSLKIAQ